MDAIELRSRLDISHPTAIEETVEAEQRSVVFRSRWGEMIFICLLVASQLMTEYFISGFAVLAPQLIRDLHLSSDTSTWPSTAFSLSVSAFLFVFGRLADVYGGYPVFLGGFIWFSLISLIAGFATNGPMIITLRALQGLGPAALLPAGTKLLCTFYPRGEKRTLYLGLYGTGAALGLFVGILLAGATAQFLQWRWFFWLGSVSLTIMSLCSYYAIPKVAVRSHEQSDQPGWISSSFIVISLGLLVFGIGYNSDKGNAGQIALKVSTILGGVAVLMLLVFVERRARISLMPMTLIRNPKMIAITLLQVFSYGAFGVFLFYGTLSFQNSIKASPLQTALWYLPFVVAGVAIGMIVKYLLHRFRGRDLLIISACGSVTSASLLSFSGTHRNYWAYIFPSMICASLGLDLTFEVVNVHMLGWVDSEHHGFIGAWVNSLFNISIALFLGLAGTVLKATESQREENDYRPAFWLQLGSAGSAMIIALFSPLPKAPREPEMAEL